MKKTIRDLDLKGRRVFIRVDFNVPIKGGRIGDETRIAAALPTIQHALQQAGTIILASHLGRPKGKPNPEMSLRLVAERLGELLERPVVFAEDCVGDEARAAVSRAGRGGVVLLENLRFHPEEEKNDTAFARELAALGDAYVNDAFGAAHRAHASTEGIVHHVKHAAAGLLMATELEQLGRVIDAPERPFVAVLGGAKVSDKIEVIENLLPRLDALLIGGAMAYTFLLSRGLPTGKSLVEPDRTDSARHVEAQAAARNLRLELPADHVVAAKAEAWAAREAETIDAGDPRIGDRMGLDIGPKTIGRYTELIRDAKTVVWNGPMGVFEVEAFAKGTLEVAKAVAAVKGMTVIGGGDSIAAVNKAGVADRITHISTGGGASLEFLGGRTLPGVAVLPDR
jgi:phosphoglycerate kinase